MRNLIVAASLVALAGGASAQQQQPSPRMAPIAAPTVQVDGDAVAKAVRALVRDNYVVAEIRPALDAALAAGIASGRYAGIDALELTRRINDDMTAVAHDKHLGIRFDPVIAEQLGGRQGGDAIQDSSFFREFARRRNHGVSRMEVLPGNIRYVAYDGFIWTGPESAAAIDAAVRFLKGGDAAIIDIRANGGGSPEAVRHFTSYFVPDGTRLVTFHLRSDPPTESVSEAIPAAERIAGMPVYVLASGHSASAAEEFASHVTGFGFAELVGEATAGAAYRNENFPVAGGFVLSVSIGRPELPKGGNWEGKGVAPTIAVPVAKALERAQQAALTSLAARSADPRRRAELEWHAATLAAKVAPATPALPLASYAGRFGPRAISVEGGKLRFRRDGGIDTLLTPIAPDVFAFDADADTRVRFVAEGGVVTALELQRIDGTSARTPKG